MEVKKPLKNKGKAHFCEDALPREARFYSILDWLAPPLKRGIRLLHGVCRPADFANPRRRYTAASHINLARVVRAFADGYMALLLPRYLTVLGFSALEIYPPACQHPVRVGSLHAQPVATGVTNVPRSFASALSPALAGYMLSVFSFGWLLVAGCRLLMEFARLLMI